MKKILALESLANYCKENGMYEFNSKDTGTQLVVQVPTIFSNDEIDESNDGFLHVKLRACHVGLNRNGSYVSEENMKKAMPTLKYRPILAAIHETDDGELEFHSHDMEIGEDGKCKYIEQQVGVFTADDPFLEYVAEYDKTYVMANAVIPLEYTEAANIIKKHDGTKVSVELVIDSLAYNVKENYLELIDFRFGGCTLLGYEKDGTPIGEGMLGSRLDISDFSIKKDTYEMRFEKAVQALEGILGTLSNFNINYSKKGGTDMSKLEELMEQYGVTLDDITFETEGLSDEELEEAFEKAFKKKCKRKCQKDDNPDPENLYRVEADGKVYEFKLSLNDTIYALQTLINDTYSENDNTYYSVMVYDKYVVMVDCWFGRAYRQDYKVRKETYSLVGDRVEVYANYLTKDEEADLEKLRSNYEELKAFKANSDYEAEKAEKMKVLNNKKYDCVRETEDFKSLVEDIDKYTVSEITTKAKVIFADNVDSENFARKGNSKPSVGVGYSDDDHTKPYGSLFD